LFTAHHGAADADVVTRVVTLRNGHGGSEI
jgi:hypothetical protein